MQAEQDGEKRLNSESKVTNVVKNFDITQISKVYQLLIVFVF